MTHQPGERRQDRTCSFSPDRISIPPLSADLEHPHHLHGQVEITLQLDLALHERLHAIQLPREDLQVIVNQRSSWGWMGTLCGGAFAMLSWQTSHPLRSAEFEPNGRIQTGRFLRNNAFGILT
jgi:hypothetical protein